MIKNETLEKEYQEQLLIYKACRKSIIYFVEKMWGLKPQPIKDEYKWKFQGILLKSGEDWQSAIHEISHEWFGEFEKGKHITWQQYLLFLCIEKAIRNEAPRKISITSGHGTGKSSGISMVILWFLFVNYNSQVPCTAPTADQMYDVLWKELSIWIDRMPKGIKGQYEWNKDHIRMVESPETWFARAKTSSKENSEALAGVHADHVLTIADEASGVEEKIFNTAEGAWTSGDILVILISNPTRAEGYFYDTHHKLKQNWQTLVFSSIESPIVDRTYEANIAERHGRDSVEYGIRVLGKFPPRGDMDDSGFIPLYNDNDIHTQPDFGEGTKFKGVSVIGVDPAGEGDDKTSWWIRDHFKAKKLHEEKVSTSKGIAEKTITFMEQYGVSPRNVVVDSFGVGADVAKEIAIISGGRYNVYSVNVGDLSDKEEDQEIFTNKRAEMYWKQKLWFRAGGEMIENENAKAELMTIKYKRNIKGKIQIMSKLDMRKKFGHKSPNDADALALTFLRDIQGIAEDRQQAIERNMYESDFDPFSVI
jgi:hypothetical protein